MISWRKITRNLTLHWRRLYSGYTSKLWLIIEYVLDCSICGWSSCRLNLLWKLQRCSNRARHLQLRWTKRPNGAIGNNEVLWWWVILWSIINRALCERLQDEIDYRLAEEVAELSPSVLPERKKVSKVRFQQKGLSEELHKERVRMEDNDFEDVWEPIRL